MRLMILAAVAVIPSLVQSQIVTERPPATATSPTVYTGQPPQYFRVESSTPGSVSFAWSLAYGINMVMLRSTGAGQPWVNLTPTPLAANVMKFTDPSVDYRQSYIYRLQVNYGSGPPGYADVPVTLPPPANPTGFTAKQTGEGTAELSWQAVPKASYYMVYGAGLSSDGVRVNGTTTSVSGTGTGNKEWFVTTGYDPGGVLMPRESWPRAIFNMVSISGNYRITLNGFQVVSATKENVITFDGAGNEVFALAYVRSYDRATGAVLSEGNVESAVHGDTEGFGGRVPAGSAKSTGGLVSGDKFPGPTPWVRGNSVSSTTFPLLLWEGSLTDKKEAVVVSPTIWEWQGDANTSDRKKVIDVINDQKSNSANLWATVSSALASQSQTWSGPTQIPLGWNGPGWVGMAGSSNESVLGDVIYKEENFTHAIGADTPNPTWKKVYSIKNNGVVFTRELIEKALNAQSQIGGMGPGVIEMKWIERYPGAAGSYTLYLQVARQ